ncbi:hypothetical protein JAAARDRAFT_209822 [Jaapia argillacea MUCL 33604]|uniref:Uncharacterized protein n=1 Tax=Jaapia argillacea MUCL 33604 TaxID=933084 RepID=A0A067PEZ1_9AGAM|nr:hypothetical protein JAAARDRAFT_209822 [Jaapia argillacea MUCL 33604]
MFVANLPPHDVLRALSFAPPPVPDLASLDPTPLGVAATTFSLYGAIGGPSPPWTMPPPSSSSYPVQYLLNTHSPSSPTPTLSFSPSSSSTSSDSSSEGERTIQTTTFTDADVQTPMPHCPSLLGYGYPYPSQFADKPSVSLWLPAVQSSSYGYGDVSTLSFDGFRTTDGGDSSNYFIPTGGVSDYASIVGGRMYC